MFFTFLNKSQVSFVDPSLLISYSPPKVLYYFYNRTLFISTDFYDSLSQIVPEQELFTEAQKNWLDFINIELNAFADIRLLRENEYLHTLGPYYYTPTQTRIYFTKTKPSSEESLCAQDLEILENLEVINPLDPILKVTARKTNKKTGRTREELIQDINFCLAAFEESARLNKQLNYFNKFLETRTAVLRNKEFHLAEPDNIPLKPEKAQYVSSSPPKRGFLKLMKAKRDTETTDNGFNQALKVYYIRYREHEKACERYKAVLENWREIKYSFATLCQKEAEGVKKNIKNLQEQLQKCNIILQKSTIHQKYQDQQILLAFKGYLETGRACDIPSCMNIFEEESLWNEIKAGQERIENTIYFLQNDNENVRLAQKHIKNLLEERNFSEMVKA
ncbi:MAG: hypothetical protein LBR98_04030 [Syntrophomonadaceae bacterium]|jgi:hypothetical protein|nr:hypothetical protein [Syntrophomonadaceae bacterium]